MDSKETQVNVLKIPDSTGYWLLRADGGKYYEDFFLNNFIAISDNEITLEKMKVYDDNNLAGITTEDLKLLYKENYDSWSPQQVAHATGRTEKFCIEMKIGDLVLVPAKRSTKFLLGIICSEVYELTNQELNSSKEVHYSISPYHKRRDIKWIKEVSRSEISEKLYWLLSAHQTIFNLQEQKEHVNQLLSPIYIQNGICHGSIKISKKEGVTANEWYELYSSVKQYTDLTTEKVIIKSNVQSPGLMEFVSDNVYSIVAITAVLSGFIIGEINFVGIKIKGILPYYQQHKKQKIDMEVKEEEKRSKQIENERAEFELYKDKEIWEIKKEKEVEQLRGQLQISSFDAGRLTEDQTQTGNSEKPNEDEL
ncbi:hypothetical protein ACFQ4Z_02910 [Oceanobacillus oncorhynchi subsp. oncorhynchi]|uniref:hypothetical protein n=1 Tax=Oceanobacillus oncorhynchi TaxID=545501 RepID=UPI0031D1C3EE